MQPFDVSELINSLFELRTVSHLWHLQTSSFAQHKALEVLYTDLVDLTDDFFEQYQGMYPRVRCSRPLQIPNLDEVSLIEYLRSFKSLLDYAHSHFDAEETSHLANVLDELKSLVTKVLYLLTLS